MIIYQEDPDPRLVFPGLARLRHHYPRVAGQLPERPALWG